MTEPYIASSLPWDKVAELHRLMTEEVKEAAVFFLDVHGVITVWNRGAEDMKGYTAKDAIGSHLAMLYTEEDRARGWPEHNLQTAKDTGFYREEQWRRRKDGSLFWARILLTALTEPSGELVGFSKITLDLTEHKLLEQCIKEREETRRVLSAANAGMWTWHAETRQVDVCKNLLALLGYAGEDTTLSFDQWISLVHPTHQALVREQFESAYRGRAGGALRLDFRMCLKDGTPRWFSAHADWHQESENRPFFSARNLHRYSGAKVGGTGACAENQPVGVHTGISTYR